MIAFVFWAIGIALAIFLGLVTHLTPVIYHLCVFFERHLVLMVERSTGQRLSMGGLILISLLAWGALGALAGGILLSPIMGGWAVVAAGSIAAAWGGSVGYQVGAQNLMLFYRRPGAVEHHRPGYIGRQEAGQTNWQQQADDRFRDGIILGEAQEEDDW